ncbi:uncharacterized threonine-rich GPI-anchored glycoprotein PJ4664.02 [Mugil cephalus]|uniref:uncharacterized threonine-rich GPI-anchored glycoprotein PJ4664.02 n=1 Tax=Mugil cephalus TaxID=48193 RepID=UPI001FB7BAB1|nr:uncharacterized threonine-rich GPI-anchored glycoprotein PJ4664.02 [Mugil cephalus]
MAPAETVEAKDEVLGTGNGTESSSKMPQTSPKTAGSVNSTFSIVQTSNLSTSTIVNTTGPIPCPQNKTLDLPSSNVNSPNAKSPASTETSLDGNPNCSAVKESSPHDGQNATFDMRSLQISSNGTTSQEVVVAPAVDLQNNTFDCKLPKQNGTITLSETSSSESHLNTLDKPSSPKVCNLTTSLKDNSSEIHPPEFSKHNEPEAATDPSAKPVETTEGTFEANPVLEVASGDGRHETKDQSKLGLNMKEGLSDTLSHQIMTAENKTNTFNLDDTLDLKVDSLITSTPMTNCKVFHFSTVRDEAKTIGAQKKLYSEGPKKPVDQMPSDVPSNIIGDRKTFLQPAAKSLWPPSKTVSQLKYKPASTLPGPTESLTSGLPMTRQRAQSKGLRAAAASDAPQGATGTSSSYNLRASTTGSKQPGSGLLKPRLSAIPSAIQRAAPGLRPPSARSNIPTSTNTDKQCGSTVPNPVAKTSQTKKHALTRGEPLPLSKRKRMDSLVPSGSVESLPSACDTSNRAKNLNQPKTSLRAAPAKSQKDDATVPANTTETSTSCDAAGRARALKPPATNHRAPLAKSQGCAKCAVLEQQLKVTSEEVKRLTAELLKYRKQEEEC